MILLCCRDFNTVMLTLSLPVEGQMIAKRKEATETNR